MSTIGSVTAVTDASVRAGLAGKGRGDLPGRCSSCCCSAACCSRSILFILLTDVLMNAVPVFAERGLSFLTAPLSPDPADAGVWQGIVGTAILGVITSLLAFPFGIATAVYLEEYAGDTKLTRFIQINIRNLAGVPSVVYGLLGLTVFVAVFGAVTDTNGRNVLAGGATLAVLVLPIVIITSIEALRAVPNTIREAGYGVGASRWEVTRPPGAARPGQRRGSVTRVLARHVRWAGRRSCWSARSWGRSRRLLDLRPVHRVVHRAARHRL